MSKASTAEVQGLYDSTITTCYPCSRLLKGRRSGAKQPVTPHSNRYSAPYMALTVTRKNSSALYGTPLIAFIGTLTGTVIERLQSHNLPLLVGGVLRGAGARSALLGGHATGVG